MKRVKVLVPFTDRVTKELRKANDDIEMTEERIAEVRAVSVNMILVLGEAEETQKETTEETPKKKSTRKKKAE